MSLSLATITSARHTLAGQSLIEGHRRRRILAAGLIAAFDLLCDLPDFERDDAPPQEREGL